MAEDFRIHFQDSGDQQHGRDFRSQSEQPGVREARMQQSDVLPEIVIDLEIKAEQSKPDLDNVLESFAPPQPEAEDHPLHQSWRLDPTIGAEFKVDLPKARMARLDLATLRGVTGKFVGTNFGLPGTVAGLSEVADRVERVRKCQKLEGTIASVSDLSDTAAGAENVACTFGRNHLDRFIPKTSVVSSGGNEFILGLRMRDDDRKLEVALKTSIGLRADRL